TQLDHVVCMSETVTHYRSFTTSKRKPQHRAAAGQGISPPSHSDISQARSATASSGLLARGLLCLAGRFLLGRFFGRRFLFCWFLLRSFLRRLLLRSGFRFPSPASCRPGRWRSWSSRFGLRLGHGWNFRFFFLLFFFVVLF